MADSTEIFDRLKQDHDKHRDLLDRLLQTSGDSEERETLFEELTNRCMVNFSPTPAAKWPCGDLAGGRWEGAKMNNRSQAAQVTAKPGVASLSEMEARHAG